MKFIIKPKMLVFDVLGWESTINYPSGSDPAGSTVES